MTNQPMNDPIQNIESSVRGYARLFPAVFQSAKGSHLYDADGRCYIDFFCGAGTLNYGHNNDRAKDALMRYIESDGIQHSLDTVTSAKVKFINRFEQLILAPRGLDYKLQFTGPTGTNAVEAAVKLARKHKKRSHIIAFTHAYHGHTLGSLSLTGNDYYHNEFYGDRNNVSHLPFDGYMGDVDTSILLEKMIEDPSSGVPVPTAIILETIQGEGGINVASDQWLKRVSEVCKKHDILLIVDDIQVGNGRTGKFFSFEHAAITPDIVCLSKSLGGGLPLSLVLIRPDCDAWQPGEHTGTFRGNNLAFVAAEAVLSHWGDSNFEKQIALRGNVVRERLLQLKDKFSQRNFDVRGRGMIWGLDVGSGETAKKVIGQCFQNGLLIESSGADDEVLKVMAALTIDMTTLDEGLLILELALGSVLSNAATPAAPVSSFYVLDPSNIVPQ